MWTCELLPHFNHSQPPIFTIPYELSRRGASWRCREISHCCWSFRNNGAGGFSIMVPSQASMAFNVMTSRWDNCDAVFSFANVWRWSSRGSSYLRGFHSPLLFWIQSRIFGVLSLGEVVWSLKMVCVSSFHTILLSRWDMTCLKWRLRHGRNASPMLAADKLNAAWAVVWAAPFVHYYILAAAFAYMPAPSRVGLKVTVLYFVKRP